MYWKRKGSRKFNQAACQAGKQRARMERPAPEYPPDLSGHTRQIVIRDSFTGTEHRFDLQVYENRRDRYRVTVDGEMCLPRPMGWTDVMELAGKSFVRVGQFTY
mgnify:CR=1 FL=1